MTETVVRQIKLTIAYNPASNSFESRLDPPPNMGPEFVWEALKLSIVTMAKAAPYYSDPIVRENVEIAAKSMKLMALGVDAAITQARAKQQISDKELEP